MRHLCFHHSMFESIHPVTHLEQIIWTSDPVQLPGRRSRKTLGRPKVRQYFLPNYAQLFIVLIELSYGSNGKPSESRGRDLNTGSGAVRTRNRMTSKGHRAKLYRLNQKGDHCRDQCHWARYNVSENPPAPVLGVGNITVGAMSCKTNLL